MRTLAAISLAGAAALGLAACGESAGETVGAGAADLAWTADLESCGFERQDRMVWGRALVESGYEMQELDSGDLNLRIWSAADGGLTDEDGALTGHAQGPAWVSADVARARGYLIYLPAGAAHVRAEADQFLCAPDAQG